MAASLPDGHKLCPTHQVSYGPLEQCSACRGSQGVAVVSGSPKADTTQKRVYAAEARLREYACWSECKTQMADDPNVAVKWSAESSKWARVAMELESHITEIEHDQWLREQKRLLSGGGGN